MVQLWAAMDMWMRGENPSTIGILLMRGVTGESLFEGLLVILMYKGMLSQFSPLINAKYITQDRLPLTPPREAREPYSHRFLLLHIFYCRG